MIISNGGVDWRYLPQASLAAVVSLARLPFSTAEWLWMTGREEQIKITAPVFIVGYWRSGTTHLHNILGQSPEFGYISPLASGLPWDILGLVRRLEPLLALALPEDRYVDNVAITPDSPQEDSIPLASMGPISYYHGLYFPKRFAEHFRRGVFFEGCTTQEIEAWRRCHVHLLKKVALHQQGRRLLLKNPVYTGHIARLRGIWPDAKFIHIVRNPYVVFQSTRHFFRRLLPELALQAYDPLAIAEIESLILESYPRLMGALASDSAVLPQNSFVELSFEALEANPLLEIQRIYAQLELPGWDAAEPRFETYIAKLAGYRKNAYAYDPEVARLVESHWQPYLEWWQQRKPD
ncbi:MAG: sulfotransferase [Chloroflexaceae bacterium]|nr:sulfotransferase [Chloroflexaceae bacterium]